MENEDINSWYEETEYKDALNHKQQVLNMYNGTGMFSGLL
jgi:hypothetical protein